MFLTIRNNFHKAKAASLIELVLNHIERNSMFVVTEIDNAKMANVMVEVFCRNEPRFLNTRPRYNKYAIAMLSIVHFIENLLNDEKISRSFSQPALILGQFQMVSRILYEEAMSITMSKRDINIVEQGALLMLEIRE